jgi:hypothetical protein
MEIDWSGVDNFIIQEGIYFFGGRDSENKSFGTLLVMKIEFSVLN